MPLSSGSLSKYSIYALFAISCFRIPICCFRFVLVIVLISLSRGVIPDMYAVMMSVIFIRPTGGWWGDTMRGISLLCFRVGEVTEVNGVDVVGVDGIDAMLKVDGIDVVIEIEEL